VSQLPLKYTLTWHTKAINALAISNRGSMLLSGGNDSRIVIWNLASGEMMQEISVPSAGFISCLAWVKLSDENEDAFVIGTSDGNIHLYEQCKDTPLFSFSSITLTNAGAVESLAWDSVHRRLASVGDGEVQVWKVGPDESLVSSINNTEKHPYVARSIHFCDDGSRVLVSYLESGFVFCYTIDTWGLKWKKKVNSRIGNTCLDGLNLLVSNLCDGVDKYALPIMHRAQSFHHTILKNVPLQIAVAHEAGWMVVGGNNGFA
ncbi:WD40 repeat-like protein, partial [Paxillus ammoniavirescens]